MSARRLLLLAVVLGVVGAAAWGLAGERGPVRAFDPRLAGPEEAAAAREAIVRWLECEECRDGELEAVRKLGRVAVPSLVEALLQGPSPATREALARALARRWRELRAAGGVRGLDRQAYVAVYLDNREAQYRVRAAVALGRIGGPEAERGLRRAAARDDLRDDELAAVRAALDRLGAP